LISMGFSCSFVKPTIQLGVFFKTLGFIQQP
jgi:hypothetical protein